MHRILGLTGYQTNGLTIMPTEKWNRVRGQWRQREFKVGGDEAPKGVECWEGVFPSPPGTPLPTGGGVWEGAIFCFVISKWRILVNSEVLTLKYLCIVSSLSGVWVDSVPNFGFSSKNSE